MKACKWGKALLHLLDIVGKNYRYRLNINCKELYYDKPVGFTILFKKCLADKENVIKNRYLHIISAIPEKLDTQFILLIIYLNQFNTLIADPDTGWNSSTKVEQSMDNRQSPFVYLFQPAGAGNLFQSINSV